MSDVNIVLLSGRLVADPELRFTPKGTPITYIRLASSRFYKDKENPESELKRNDLFITAETFGKLAERIPNYIKKGTPVIVKGRLVLNEWKSGDGKTKQTYRLYAEDVNWSTAGKTTVLKNQPESDKTTTVEENSIPF